MEASSYTAPVGLLGVLMMTMRVQRVMALSMASTSIWKVSGVVGTSTHRQCHAWMYMRYSGKYGVRTMTSSPGTVSAPIVAVMAPAQPAVRMRLSATAARVDSQPLLGE